MIKEIGAVNDIAKLEHILLPHPSSWWIAETKFIKFKDGEWKEEIVSKEKIYFNWLKKLLKSLDETLKSEGILSTYLRFSPSKEEEKEKGTIYLECKPSYLSCFLRDIGIFTKKFFLASKQLKTRKTEYGNLAEKFAEKLQTYGIEVKYAEFEGGAFISNGEIGIVSIKSDLKNFQELVEECGKLYEFPAFNLHIDNFINFLNKELFLVNYSCLRNVANDIEYIECCLSDIDKIVDLLKKKGYNSIEIHEYSKGSEYVVGNLLTLGNNKVVLLDPSKIVSRKIEKEGIDAINLYEKESFDRLSRLRAGIRCLTLPIKRNY